MNNKQFFDITFPISSEKGPYFLDLNKDKGEKLQSELLHLVFTPKGQKIRDPEFGTNLIKYIFSQNDEISSGEIKTEISEAVAKYVPDIKFDDVKIYSQENDDNGKIVSITYTTMKGIKEIKNNVSIKL